MPGTVATGGVDGAAGLTALAALAAPPIGSAWACAACSGIHHANAAAVEQTTATGIARRLNRFGKLILSRFTAWDYRTNEPASAALRHGRANGRDGLRHNGVHAQLAERGAGSARVAGRAAGQAFACGGSELV